MSIAQISILILTVGGVLIWVIVCFKKLALMTNDGFSKKRIIVRGVVTLFVLSGAAVLYALAMRIQHSAYSIIDAQSVVSSWASLVMGIFMTIRLENKWRELLTGCVFFVVCLVPIAGGLVGGVGYFSVCFAKLEKSKNDRTDAA